MKPSARRRVERAIGQIAEADSGECSICRKPFPHNSLIFGGVGKCGNAKIVGDCCTSKLTEIVLQGVFVLSESALPKFTDDQTADLMSKGHAANATADDIKAAIKATQGIIGAHDKFKADVLKRAGLKRGCNAIIETEDQPWKTDDAAWFRANPMRTHRFRPAFPGELETLHDKLSPVTSGHEYKIIVRQVSPGMRVRFCFAHNLTTPVPDIDAIIHALADLTQQDGDEPLSVERVDSLARKYASLSTQKKI